MVLLRSNLSHACDVLDSCLAVSVLVHQTDEADALDRALRFEIAETWGIGVLNPELGDVERHCDLRELGQVCYEIQ
jgi:hypothetical protein